jgi:hypothetical protein
VSDKLQGTKCLTETESNGIETANFISYMAIYELCYHDSGHCQNIKLWQQTAKHVKQGYHWKEWILNGRGTWKKGEYVREGAVNRSWLVHLECGINRKGKIGLNLKYLILVLINKYLNAI